MNIKRLVMPAASLAFILLLFAGSSFGHETGEHANQGAGSEQQGLGPWEIAWYLMPFVGFGSVWFLSALRPNEPKHSPGKSA